MKIGLISNGRSRRNRRTLARVSEIAGAAPDVEHAVLDGVEGLEEALAGFAALRMVVRGAARRARGDFQDATGRPMPRQPFFEFLRRFLL